ncbi:MAG: DsbA family oxidoreductase [Muribaculaceae bacterium]|nr:DsbA family oxidoreductase [Muribaculaceae bacterium]
MMNLVIWSDFACPYCYIGETRLQKAIEELGISEKVNIEYRAFELDPTAPKEVTGGTPERFAKKYRLSIEDATKQIEEISRLGKEAGIDFRYATTRYSNTRDAHRLMKLAEAKYDHNTVERLNKALFDAYFTKNLVLADPKVLLETAMGVGMDEKDIKAVLDSDMYEDEVRFDEREAAMRGVRGVPYIIFGGDFAVPGAMTVDGFKSALNRELRRQEKDLNENKHGNDNERPHVCGPDGCELI